MKLFVFFKADKFKSPMIGLGLAALFALAMGAAVAQAASPETQRGTQGKDKDKIVRIERVGNIEKLSFMAAGEITYEQSPSPSLRIYGPSGIVNGLIVERSGGELSIKAPKGSLPASDVKELRNVKVSLASPALRSVNIDGAARFKAAETWETDSAAIIVNGFAEVTIGNLRCKKLRFSSNGKAEAGIRVHCDSIAVDCYGMADIKLAGSAVHLAVDNNALGKVATKRLKIRAGGHPVPDSVAVAPEALPEPGK